MTDEELMETGRVLRDIMIRGDIGVIICNILFVIIAIFLFWIICMERKERKARDVDGGRYFCPTVTDDIQIGPDGTEFHRMGIPGRR